jgi:hypothetical protein
LTGAKRQELSQDLQDLEEYLNKIINNPDTFKPSEHPFIPTHTKEFFALMEIRPTPEQYKAMNKEASTQVESNQTSAKNENQTDNRNNTPGNNRTTYGDKDYLDTFKT